MERLAEPGGICISGTVYDHVETKLALNYESLGEQTVKNIARPVRAYRIKPEDSGSSTLQGQGSTLKGLRRPRRVGSARRRGILAAVVSLVLLAGTLGSLRFLPFSFLGTQHRALVTEEAQPPPLPLPDKPSIAVLPFINMNGDPEQDYFSDGITDTLITDLSKLSELVVLARHSTFFYKGKSVKVTEVSRKLGVRYVVEGSVQKAGNQVRINIQLIDATTGGHVWAERYDRDLKDIFSLQDEIVQKIVRTLKLQLTLGAEQK